jgi:hypothetical protein
VGWLATLLRGQAACSAVTRPAAHCTSAPHASAAAPYVSAAALLLGRAATKWTPSGARRGGASRLSRPHRRAQMCLAAAASSPARVPAGRPSLASRPQRLHNGPVGQGEGDEEGGGGAGYETSVCVAMRHERLAAAALRECGGRAYWLPARPTDPAIGGPGWGGWGGWEEYLNGRECPGFVTGFLLPVTRHLSAPLTILHAAALLGLVPPHAPAPAPAGPGASRAELRVDLIGATRTAELAPWGKLEEVLHLLPALRRLTTVMVSPDLAHPGRPGPTRFAVHGGAGPGGEAEPAELGLCGGCRGAGVEWVLETHGVLYHEYRAGPDYRRPDLAVALHSACSDLGRGPPRRPGPRRKMAARGGGERGRGALRGRRLTPCRRAPGRGRGGGGRAQSRGGGEISGD